MYFIFLYAIMAAKIRMITVSPVMLFLFWLFCVQVKQIMEEAVTKKFVHEDSSHIIALCSKYALLFSLWTHTHTHCLLLFLPPCCTHTLVELLSR